MKDLFNNSISVKTGPEAGLGGGSTDFGNVTYRLPSCHPGFAIPAPVGQGNHTPGFTNAARSRSSLSPLSLPFRLAELTVLFGYTAEAHEETLKAATWIAIVGARIISDESFAEEVSSPAPSRSPFLSLLSLFRSTDR